MAHGGGPGTSGSSNTSSLGSSSNSGSHGSGGNVAGTAAGAASGSSASGAAHPSFMSRVLGFACHAIRPSAPKELAKAAQLRNAIVNELEDWRGDKPNEDLSAFLSSLDQIASAPIDPNASNAGAQWAKQNEALAALLDTIQRQRPIVLPSGDELNNQTMPGWSKLPLGDRPQRIRDLAAKIDRGRDIMSQLRDPNGTPPQATKDTVSDLMFYLRAQSDKAAGKPWYRGAMTIPDPGGRVRGWLNSTSNAVYMRPSSHLKPDQQGAGHTGRGIDFDKHGRGLDRHLPFGMRTLLYQGLTRQGSEMLYIKMESEGTRVNPYNFMGGLADEARAPVRVADVKESIAHLINLLHTEADYSQLARHGEKYSDLPGGVRNAYDSILAAVGGDANMSLGAERGGSFQDGRLTDMTVAQMAENIASLQAALDSGASGLTPNAQTDLQNAIDAWNTAGQAAWGPEYRQDLPYRVGDEVIVRDEHLPEIPR
ncbi:MAG: hypothetical protein U0414_26645 [Polyangiaceae bacterium]